MTAAGLAHVLREGAPFVVLGGLVGAAYFAALWLNVEQYLLARSLGVAVALYVGRQLLAGTAFALIAPSGATPLLGALAGFVLARAVAVRCRGPWR